MTLTDLQKDEKLRSREFPVCSRGVFLAHAGVSPLPRVVMESMSRYLEACQMGDQEDVFPQGLTVETRQLGARMLGCSVEEVALVGPTSLGLSMVAGGLDWKAGDNVVFYPDDYPSNVAPWMLLAEKGVELRKIQTGRLGEITLDHVKPLVNQRTRLVALASAHFISGWRLDVDGIGSWLREQGVLFCVDGIQTVGALATLVRHVDFLAADAHKWLLGPCAAGLLYVRREVQEKLRPLAVGWGNVKCPGYVMPDEIQWPSHAGRYEAGSGNLAGIVGMHAALKLLDQVGFGLVEKTILGHVDQLRKGLKGKGGELAGGDGSSSGIVSFKFKGRKMDEIHCQLAEKGITTSLRQTRDGTRWIRLSPHFYNTREELEKTLDAL